MIANNLKYEHQKEFTSFSDLFSEYGMKENLLIFGWIRLNIFTTTDFPVDISNIILLYFDAVSFDRMQYKRFVVIIDRREIIENWKEEIWLFEPMQNCRHILKELAVHCHWFLSHAQSAMLPGYDNVRRFGVFSHNKKTAAMTVSFRVKEPECIKCYGFIHCSMTALMDDMIELLAYSFDKSTENKEFINNQKLTSRYMNIWNKTVSDKYYNDFVQTYLSI